MAEIKIRRVHKSYGSGQNETHVLRGINFQINIGDFVAITGPSGSGKTTLMNILGLLDVPSSGEYFLDTVDTSTLTSRAAAKVRKNNIGFIFQNFNLLPRQHVIDNITLPMIYKKVHRLRRERIAHELLELVGLTERGYYLPTQLSGGQKQRVAIARALANKPKLILADEPTGNLDSKTGEQIIELLRKLNQRGHTIIVVTHDETVAEKADRIIHIVDGKIDSDTDFDDQNSKKSKVTKKSEPEPDIDKNLDNIESIQTEGGDNNDQPELIRKIEVTTSKDEKPATAPRRNTRRDNAKYHRSRASRSNRRSK